MTPFILQLFIALALAIVNYQHWDGYRKFAASLHGPASGHRVWVDNDWGLRYYLEADHARADALFAKLCTTLGRDDLRAAIGRQLDQSFRRQDPKRLAHRRSRCPSSPGAPGARSFPFSRS